MANPNASENPSINQSVTGAKATGKARRRPSRPYSNLDPLSRRPRRRPAPPGTIPRGPYVGLRRRPKPNRHRYLSLDQVGNLTNALAFADSLSLSLSVQVTVAWDLMPGFQPGDWSARQTALVVEMSEWLRRHGIEPAFAWTREVSGSQFHHTHFQLHIPKQHTMRTAVDLVDFLRHRFGFPDEGVVASLGKYGMWTPAMRAGDFIYLLKAFDHRDFRYLNPDETVNIGAALGIEHRGSQGEVSIKRAGTSANLGKAARRAAGWVERRSLEDLRAILRPPLTPKKTKTKGLLLGRRGQALVYLPPRLPEADPQGPPQRPDRLRVVEAR
jgi:hypothetical protein